MSKKNSREAKAARRAERETRRPAPVQAGPIPAGQGEACPKCGKPGGHSHDRDAVIHFPGPVVEFPRDFEKRYEVVYERTMFKFTHRWVLPRTASEAEKDELRSKLTEKYRRKPRKVTAAAPDELAASLPE